MEHEKATPRPWKVEPGFGQVWTVIGPGDVAIGENFCLREDAEHIAGYLNDAYEAAYDASRALIEQMRDALKRVDAGFSGYNGHNHATFLLPTDGPSKITVAIAAADKFLGEK